MSGLIDLTASTASLVRRTLSSSGCLEASKTTRWKPIHEEVPELSKGLTTPAEAKQYAEFTGNDMLAPAVGNMHGMLPSMVEGKTRKRLDIARIAEIKKAAQVLLTLHGGSGTDDEDFRMAIAAGINVIHINTELRVAWRRGLEGAMRENPNEVVPYKLLQFALESVKQVARSRISLFNAEGLSWSSVKSA
jgi:fructose-bisphosphate aldolase class II